MREIGIISILFGRTAGIRAAIYDMEQRGEFPQRFYLTSRCVVWDLAEVEAWLEERRRASRAKTVKRAPMPDVQLRKTRPIKHPARA
ncbi:MAG: AlpA family phage regulatory protein [Rhizobiaceae bacterium]